jgi:mannose-6-phosphate isomerase
MKPSNRIGILKNIVQAYDWGSYTAIPELLGKETVSERPQAELWMGAHPKAPSRVQCDDGWISLLELIEKNPKDILGKEAAEKFDNRLPYLFKVLAAAKPLSIQAHPGLAQARQGFERENRLGIPLDGFNRNYKDNNHKPECICALTPYWALKGFRKISDILSLWAKIRPAGLEDEIDALGNNPTSKGLKDFFNRLMTMDRDRRRQAVTDAVKKAQKFAQAGESSKEAKAFEWMIRLNKAYPEDIGVFAPAMLNLICLQPGQALFIPAGELHSYLEGTGIELMANSDNVLRGGLTPKHVDVPELLRILSFEDSEPNILVPVKKSECERVYPSFAEEFVLSVISVKKSMTYTSPLKRSAGILLCTEGESIITDIEKDEKIAFVKGSSAIVPASVRQYGIEGSAVIYKAAVPV